MTTPPTPFERSYWVVPHLLLAGYYPGSSDTNHAMHNLNRLLDVGIRCFINLMLEAETDQHDYYCLPYRECPPEIARETMPYNNLLFPLARERGLAVTYIRFPMQGLTKPPAETIQHILDTIDLSIRTGRPVYIHCWAGIGRTGMVVGCYLARHGIASGDAAIAKIKQLRTHDAMAHLESPESEAQAQIIRTWKHGT
jgi:hypothetical protein